MNDADDNHLADPVRDPEREHLEEVAQNATGQSIDVIDERRKQLVMLIDTENARIRECKEHIAQKRKMLLLKIPLLLIAVGVFLVSLIVLLFPALLRGYEMLRNFIAIALFFSGFILFTQGIRHAIVFFEQYVQINRSKRELQRFKSELEELDKGYRGEYSI